MTIISYCLIATILVSVYLSSTIVVNKKALFSKFKNSLSPYQKEIYLKIVQERANIFVLAVNVSLILSVVLVYIFFRDGPIKPSKITCFFVASTLSISSLFYLLYPKTDYMVKYLDKI